MTAKNRLPKIIIIVSFTLTLVAAAALGGLYLLRRVQRIQAAANVPPTVVVNAPAEGDTTPAGGFLQVQISVAAQNPISRLELWLDGELVETQTPDPSLGDLTTYHAISQLQVLEGLHLFSARAVDAVGLVGQSQPIAIEGQARLAENGEANSGSSGQNGGSSNPPGPNSGQPGGGQPPANSGQPGGGAQAGSGTAIIPPAPLPAPPSNVPMLQVVGMSPAVDLASLIPVLLRSAPSAPTSVQAGYENCTVRLTWMDNADNESGLNIWMQALGGPPKVIATLTGSPQTGPAWYEFAAPTVGIYSFWIEAQNGLGRQSSEIVWVGVTDLDCSPGIATQLNVDVVDMFASGGYDRVYCYLSVEGAPEKRVPAQDGQFIQVLGGWGNISNWTGSGSSFLLPEPQDGELTLEGECLGWRGGGGPDGLGSFKASFPSSQWDGRRLELRGAGFTIGVRINPYGAAQASGFFTYTDYTIPSPSQPWVTTETSSDVEENERLARRPTLHWTWAGDSTKLTGFTIFLDGKFFRTVPAGQGGQPGQWQEMFVLLESCGGTYRFQVAANYGEAQSAPSAVVEYRQPGCGMYAEVVFETVTFTAVDDGSPGSCNTANAYYTLWVGQEKRQFGQFEGEDIQMDCGTFYFSRLPALTPQEHDYASVDTFIVPLSTQNPSSNYINIWASFTDNDPFFLDDADTLCIGTTEITKSLRQWENLLMSGTSETYQLSCDDNGHYDFDAEGYVTVSLRVLAAPSTSP